MPIRESVYGTIPKFVKEGYALYKGGEYLISKFDGKEIIVGRKDGLDYIGIRPDAPDWALDEYDELIAERNERIIAAYKDGYTVEYIANCFNVFEREVKKVTKDIKVEKEIKTN